MVASLPRAIQLKLEQTLAQWRQWQCEPPLTAAPEPVSLLSNGLSNFSVLVDVGPRQAGPRQAGPRQAGPRQAREQLVVRIDGINPAAHGLSRQGEWRALLSANRAGMAPQPRYFNPELGTLVCDYLPPDEDQGLSVIDLATLLRGIHRLPARHHRLDLAERMRGYEKQLEHRGCPRIAQINSCRGQVAQVLTKISRHRHSSVLCHNDLLRTNRIYSGGQLWAIDWEYCAMGDAWYDIAVAVTGDELSPQHTMALLESYLERAPAADELQRLQQYKCVYRYLELLWYLAPGRRGLPQDDFEHMLVQLDRALLQLPN